MQWHAAGVGKSCFGDAGALPAARRESSKASAHYGLRLCPCCLAGFVERTSAGLSVGSGGRLAFEYLKTTGQGIDPCLAFAES